jgi:hypothetical protein
MAHGKKMVKKRLMIKSGMEMYKHRIAGAFMVLIPNTLCVLSEVLKHIQESKASGNAHSEI